MSSSLVVTASCPDQVGITAAITGLIASHGGWIIESSQHTEQESAYFFVRVEIRADSLPFGIAEFRDHFAPLAERFEMQWEITDLREPSRVILLVSCHDHCLADLLYRWRTQEMAFAIPCVVSNHQSLASYVAWHGIDYHHLATDTAQQKLAADSKIEQLIEKHQADTIVLARYMQMIPPQMCRRYAGRIINIHHSFLPSFSGGSPYRQACRRGVKLVGATCHYVTEELDGGPIIDQDVIRVDHSHSVADMQRLGKDVERRVLARGLRLHLEKRILLHGERTVIL